MENSSPHGVDKCTDRARSARGAHSKNLGLRKDAALNRKRLLKAGREVFAAQGFEATLNDVARHAGLGVGTAYRNFANKEELIDAIVAQQVHELEDVLHHALDMDDAWQGLVYYMEQSLRMQIHDRGMAQLFTSRHAGRERYDWSRDRIAPFVNAVAERARGQGSIRTEITGTDLILIQFGIVAIAESLHESVLTDTDADRTTASAHRAHFACHRQEHEGGKSPLTSGDPGDAAEASKSATKPSCPVYLRYLWIALDGIRASTITKGGGRNAAVQPLPVTALDTDALHAALA